jgi:hypothetical protein
MTTRADEFWLETLRRIAPEEKLEIVMDLMDEGFGLRVLGVRLRFPALSDEEARRRATEEALACLKKDSLRKSPLF